MGYSKNYEKYNSISKQANLAWNTFIKKISLKPFDSGESKLLRESWLKESIQIIVRKYS